MITVRHGEAADLKPARRHLEKEHPKLLDAGPAAVVWAILDQVVDDYEPVVGGIDDDIEEVEQAVFEGGAESTQRIYFLKREVIEFHRAVAPLLAAAGGASSGGPSRRCPSDLRRFFREVVGRRRRIDEQVNSQRELLTSILEANLSLISVRQNEVVQAISAWAAIIAVPTFFASIWGMNFEHMPELRPPIRLSARARGDVHRDAAAVPLLQADQVALMLTACNSRSPDLEGAFEPLLS